MKIFKTLYRYVIVWILVSFITSNGIAAQIPAYKQAFQAYQTQQFDKAESIWETLSQSGDPNAQYALGVMHLRSETKSPTAQKAFRWFEKAAKQDHSTAMFNVGVAYWEGKGVKQDRHKALSWWKNAAELGDNGAQFNLGLAYYVGEEVKPDIEQAARWIHRAAAQNHPEAIRIMKVISKEQPEIVRKLEKLPDTTTTSQLAASSGAHVNIKPTIIAAEKVEPAQDIEQKIDPSQPGNSTQTGVTEVTASAENLAKANLTTEVEAVSVNLNAEKFDYWKTISETIPLLTAPNKGVIFSSLSGDTPVEIIKRTNDWAKITLPDGLKLWIYKKYIRINGNMGIVSGTNVRARPHPSTKPDTSPPVGKFRKGDNLKVIDHQGNWVRVRAPMHLGAWVSISNLLLYRDSKENRNTQWQEMVARGL